jgi:imidazolonepropionase
MTHVDLMIHGAAQLVTCAGAAGVNGPKRGAALGEVGEIAGGAVAVAKGMIVAVGEAAALREEYYADREVDAKGGTICPGFVDAHTHLVFAGDRTQEFARKLGGASYMEILQAGGGILSTMRATRAAPLAELTAFARSRLYEMSRLGTTTAEIKSGYGLDTTSELKILDAIAALAAEPWCEIFPTFLGAHAVPPPYSKQPHAYTQLIIDEMLPAVNAWHAASPLANKPLFCDVFCEPGAFDYTQTSMILRAAQAYGMPLKLHADEFATQGGVPCAVELGAVSVDHLDVTPPADVAILGRAATIAVLLPAVNFHLGSNHFADARGLIAAGAAVALATDANPGSAPCLSLPLVMAIACRYQKLTPAEALNAVTINAAHALGAGDRLGSLEVGKQADILIVDAPDYRHLAYWFGHNLVRRVFKRGVEVTQRAQHRSRESETERLP